MEFISRSPEQTKRVGMRLGAMLQPGDVICLIGDLGSGKTTFVQGVAAGWGSLDSASSPTFVLVNLYRRPDGKKLFHLDAYRISNAVEAEYLDIDTIMEQGPLIVEWADRIQEALPKDQLTIAMRYISEDQRDMVIFAEGERYSKLLKRFRGRVYGVA